MLNLSAARFPGEKPLIESLFRDYEQFIAVDLCFQDFDAELGALPGRFAPPKGNILLARLDNKIAGCIAWHPLQERIAEVKRLFVRPAFQGHGICKALLTQAIYSIRESGYTKLWLDSLERLVSARKLYESFDFKPIPPYNGCPLPDFYCMELELKK